MLVVTHLPQVAAFADHQLLVAKATTAPTRRPRSSRSTATTVSSSCPGCCRVARSDTATAPRRGAARRRGAELRGELMAADGAAVAAAAAASRCAGASIGRRVVDTRTKDLVTPTDAGRASRSSTTRTSTASRPRAWSTAGRSAVVNAAASSSGRYPNDGPLLLLRRRHPAGRRRSARRDGPSSTDGTRHGHRGRRRVVDGELDRHAATRQTLGSIDGDPRPQPSQHRRSSSNRFVDEHGGVHRAAAPTCSTTTSRCPTSATTGPAGTC